MNEQIEKEIRRLESMLIALEGQEEAVLDFCDQINADRTRRNVFDSAEPVSVYQLQDTHGAFIYLPLLVAKADVIVSLMKLRYIAKPSVTIHNHGTTS